MLLKKRSSKKRAAETTAANADSGEEDSGSSRLPPETEGKAKKGEKRQQPLHMTAQQQDDIILWFQVNYSYSRMFNETETENLLQKVTQDLRNPYIPIIVFLIFLALIGIPGNVTTAVYFGFKKKKTSIDTFIMILACVDLFVCGCIFVYIHELSNNDILQSTSKKCKVTYFVFRWAFSLSVAIVCAIAVDRFIKVILVKHLKCTTVRNMSLAIALACFLGSLRDFWTYDSIAVNITISDLTVEGRVCMNVWSKDLQWVVKASHVTDTVLFSCNVLILICAYGGIIYKLYTHRERMNKTMGPDSGHAISSAERNITWMMLSASVALLVCFLPYFIVMLSKFHDKSVEYELSAGNRSLLCLLPANSVCNPIIYCFFTPEYRRYITSLFTRCIQRNKYGIHSSTETR